MNDRDQTDTALIDLGDVATVTRGQAVARQDASIGQQSFALGIVED
ncbi:MULTISPECIES: hypothetical protein [unclassified Novosphingobium]|nr:MULTISPECIES: hypothetical protein [unclassified Novosphingobium]MBB3356264.1 hypothetical protein [Novosphingobium sp. BK256]MBB3372665.1 hypothetical protein [Novosphingobium sp. BK280]MBB3377032.1 hypothetical protein [Novosphingobium sp. BK258]MBB3419556.1 hypothetical protein [Novosphingobium sp. BK267]MBB3448627.1 hypothetical protein [Novosphingobium sp. BK352]